MFYFFYSFVPVCLGQQCEGVSVCDCVWYVNTQIIVTLQTIHRMSYKNLLTTLTVVRMGLTTGLEKQECSSQEIV